MGSGLPTPGSGGTPASRAARDAVSAVTEHHLPPVSEDPLRPVDHQEHEPDSHQREPESAYLGRADEAGRDKRGGDRLAQATVGVHQGVTADGRTEYRDEA